MKRLLITLLPVIMLAACGGPYQLEPSERDTAELGAVKYAQADGAKFVACAGQDSDKDGNVTCTLKDDTGAPKELLCSYKSQGCKAK